MLTYLSAKLPPFDLESGIQVPVTEIGSSVFCIFIIPNGNETPPTLYCLRRLRKRAFSTYDSPLPANKTWFCLVASITVIKAGPRGPPLAKTTF